MMLERVIRGVSVLVVTVYVARYLGPGRFGLLSYAISLVAIFAMIGLLGLDSIVVRNLVQNPSDRDRILGTAFALKVSGAIIAILMVVVTLQIASNETYTKALVTIVAIGILFKSLNVIEFYFQATVKGRRIAFSQLCAVTISTAFQICLVFMNAELIWFACALAFENLLLGLFFLIMYRKEEGHIKNWRWDSTIAKDLIGDSWPLLFSSLMVMLYMRIDQIMIKEMLDVEAVGNYAAAVRLSEALYFIPLAIVASLFPAVINARKVDYKLYIDRLKQLYTLMFWMAIVIAIPTVIISKYAIEIFFGSEFSAAVSVLKIHIWACVFVFLGIANQKYLLVENLVLILFYQTIIGSMMNIFCNYRFIPHYGIIGAAYATLLTQAAILVILLFNNRARKSLVLMVKAMNPIGFGRGLRH